MKPVWAQQSHGITFHAFKQFPGADGFKVWRGLCTSSRCDEFTGPRDTYEESQGRTCPSCKKAVAILAKETKPL